MLSELRFDYLPYRDIKMSRTDEGFVTGMAPVAKVGILRYRLADGSVRRELVPAETLFAQDSIETLKLKPLTSTHPPEQLLTASSVKSRQVGTTGENIVREDDFLCAKIVVTDADAIKKAEEGRRQLSPGYRCELQMDSGVYNGEPYDAVQIRRLYNHVALVDVARGGPELQIKFDSEDIIQPQARSPRMIKIALDGIEYDAAPEVGNHVKHLQAKCDEANAAVVAAKAENDKLQAEFDSIKAKLDAAEKIDIVAEAKKIADARISLVGKVSKHLDAETTAKLDSMSDEDIQNAVIVKAFPNAADRLETASKEYRAARFDCALELLEAPAPSALPAQRQAMDPKPAVKKDSDEESQDAARERMLQAVLNGYKE